ncbi:MAG: ZIP family metal transporter [Sphingomonadaceae bacterium]
MTTWLPYAVGAVAGLFTLAGGVLAIRLLRHETLLFGLTSGFVIGLALLDLMPNAIQLGNGHHSAAAIFAMLAAGFALLTLLNRLPIAAVLGRGSLILHSVMDGLGIGLAFQISTGTGWVVAIAILIHDMADGANIIALSASAQDHKNARNWLVVNSIAPLLGVAAGQSITVTASQFSLLLALFAGGFLYIGSAELLPRSRAVGGGWFSSAVSVLGLVMTGLVVHLAH